MKLPLQETFPFMFLISVLFMHHFNKFDSLKEDTGPIQPCTMEAGRNSMQSMNMKQLSLIQMLQHNALFMKGAICLGKVVALPASINIVPYHESQKKNGLLLFFFSSQLCKIPSTGMVGRSQNRSCREGRSQHTVG